MLASRQKVIYTTFMSIESNKKPVPAFDYEFYRAIEERNVSELFLEQLNGEFIESKIAQHALGGRARDTGRLLEEAKEYDDLASELVKSREKLIEIVAFLETVPGKKAKTHALFLAKFIEGTI